MWIRGGELLMVHLDRLPGNGAEGLMGGTTSRALHQSEDVFPDACHVQKPVLSVIWPAAKTTSSIMI